VLEVEAFEDGVLEEVAASGGDVVVPLQRVGSLRLSDATVTRVTPPRPVGVLSRARSAVAERTRQSKQRVPHFYLFADVDMSAAQRLRDAVRAAGGRPPTLTALVVRAVALTLAGRPDLNVSYVDGELAPRDAIGVGIAVGTDDALVVAVVADADRLDLTATANEVREATRRAREGRLRQSDLGPRSAVVSNLGMHGVQAFLAIIDEPDPFIVAVGAVRDAVVAVDGAAAVRPVSTLGLSVDHRALDGVQAAGCLGEIRRHLERADELLR
jgi:pyruvate dehydrogenase E2 component (dihydrolipoamide acetyltransferase)